MTRQGKQLIVPRPSTRENGAKGRDGVETGSKPIRDDDGRKRDEVSKHAGDSTRHISDGEIMAKTRELRPSYRRITSTSPTS